MIKHIVMWKLKEFAEGADKLDNARKAKSMLEDLRKKIKEIKFIEVGININISDNAYDIVLYSEFNNEKELENYLKYAKQIRVSDFVKRISKDKVVVDYEV